jgi:phospholipase D-like protein/putative oligomerization/nucleic acid binding protein
MVAADYPFLDIFWTMLIFFAWLIWFWILITILIDVFRRHDVSGWGKAAWCLFLIFLPLIGVLTYLIVQGKGMAERSVKEQQSAKAEADSYIRSVATSADPAEQIAKGKQLLDSGAITQAEFDALKQKALATA